MLKNACWDCGNYKECYTKEKSNFQTQNFGLCSVKKEVVKRDEICENWCHNQHKLKIRKAFIEQELSFAIDRLLKIRKILEEDREHYLK